MAAPTLQASGTLAAITTGNLTVVLPAHQADDILIVTLMAWLPNSTGTAVTSAPGGGWAKADNATSIATTIDGENAIFWLRATASGTTDPVFTRPAGWDTGTDGVWAGRAYIIRGCITTGDPWDALAKNSTNLANGTFPAVTVSGSERHVIQFLCKPDNNGAVTVASGWTIDTAATSATGTDSSFQTIRQADVSASTTADTATITAPAQAGTDNYTFFGASFKPVPPADIAGTISTTWGGWSGTSSATVNHPATAAGTWPGWAGTSSATVSAGATNHPGTISTTWGGWSGTASATVEHPATTNTTWPGWSGTASATVEHPATISTTWGGWSGTANGTVSPPVTDHPATISTTWGGFTGTSSATVEHPATIAATWGGWAGIAAGLVDHKAIIGTTWGGWVGTAIVPDGTPPPSGGNGYGPLPLTRGPSTQNNDDEVLLLIAL